MPPSEINPEPNSTDPSLNSRRAPSRKTVIIAVICVVVIVIIGTLLFLASRPSTTNSSDNGLYTKRAGYQATSSNSSIGDPLALTSTTTKTIAHYRGGDVIQPCTLLTLNDIRNNGLRTKPDVLTSGGVQRIYLDDKSQLPLDSSKDEFSLPSTEDSNSCSYYLDEQTGRIEIDVYQPTYANPAAVNDEISRRYTPDSTKEGLQVFKQTPIDGYTNPIGTTYFIKSKSDTFAKLTINTSNNDAKDKILTLLARNFAKSIDTPTPSQAFHYSSPIFAGSVVNACDLFDNQSFKNVLKTDAGPLVNELLASAIGVVQSGDGQKQFNYAITECKRRTPQISTEDSTLRVKATTYETEEGAKSMMSFEQSSQSMTQNLQHISPAIGDESFYGDTAGMEKAVVIRKGRVIVHMAYYNPSSDSQTSPAQRIQALSPMAKSIANKL